MFKKIVLGTLTVAMIALLVVGAVNRTLAKTGDDEEVNGAGRRQNTELALGGESYGQGRGGLGQTEEAPLDNRGGWGNAQEQAGNGGRGNGGANNSAAGTPQAEVTEWVTIQGTVSGVADDLVTIETDAGEEVIIEGRALLYLQETGFASQVGASVAMTGFYEDGEFKVGEILNSDTGQGVQVRETSGRPLWAGRGRRS